MNTKHTSFTLRASVLAVRGALIAMAISPVVYAADEEPTVEDLTKPTSTVEVGAGVVSDGSYKAGEYNGLEKKGGYAIGNVDVKGGGSYDSDNTTRWRVKGTDLGLETRDLTVDYGQQGKFKVNFGYDELLHNISDSYQTPYVGAGSNNLTLPSNWIKPQLLQNSATATNFRALSPTVSQDNALVTGVVKAPTAAQTAAMNAMQAADLPDFQNVDLYTKRTRYDGGFSYLVDPQWEIKASTSHMHKDGYKPMGTVSEQVSEYSATLPDPISQTTDQYNLSANYTGDKAFAQLAYYGSIFSNDVKTLTWEDANDLTKFATMSSAPSNQFHQLSATGGYNFSRVTKLVGDVSYARNTQNDSFSNFLGANAQNGILPLGVPTASLNGVVITKALDLKLTTKPVDKLNVAAAYKYNDRDNQTPVNTYVFRDDNVTDAGVLPFNSALGTTGLGSLTNVYQNRAYSKKINQFNLDADYNVAKGNYIKAGYDYQQIDRYCNGSWIDCADANTTKEDTGRIEWRTTLRDDFTGRIGYAYSKRTVDYNENAFLSLVPMANVAGTGTTSSVYQFMQANGLTGFGPLAGLPAAPLTGDAGTYIANNGAFSNTYYGSRNVISELPGMRRYNMADRNRDKVRASANWQVNDQFSLSSSVDYNKDDYSDSVYGLLNAKSWAVDVDGTYAVNDDVSMSLFYTYEDQRSQSAGDAFGSNSTATNSNGFTAIVNSPCYTTLAAKNANAKMDSCLDWSTDMHDRADTIGFTLRDKNLMAGRLDLSGDLSYVRATTDVGVNGGSYVTNPLAVAGAPAGTVAQIYIAASPTPTVTNDSVQLRLNGKYQINKASAVHVGYSYLHLRSTDYSYDGMQYGSVTNVLPTNQQAPSYNVQILGISYLYSFR